MAINKIQATKNFETALSNVKKYKDNNSITAKNYETAKKTLAQIKKDKTLNKNTLFIFTSAIREIINNKDDKEFKTKGNVQLATLKKVRR